MSIRDNIVKAVYELLLVSQRDQDAYKVVVTRAIQSFLHHSIPSNTLLRFVTLLSPPTFDFEIDEDDNVIMRIYLSETMNSDISELTNISISSSSNLTISSLFAALGYNNVSIAYWYTELISETDYRKFDGEAIAILMDKKDTNIRLNNILPKKGWIPKRTPNINYFEYVSDERIMKLIKDFCELQGIHDPPVQPKVVGGKKKKKSIKKKVKSRKYIYRKRKRSTRKR